MMNIASVCLKTASGALSQAPKKGQCWSRFRFCAVTGATLPQRSFRCRRFDHIVGRDEEAAYLSGLQTLWRGFIHMHAVAKLVTKAFPVSGIMDNLNEVTSWTKTNPPTHTHTHVPVCKLSPCFVFQQDLPDSIQVGGRISPQIVWDYLEKIRATGTKVRSKKSSNAGIRNSICSIPSESLIPISELQDDYQDAFKCVNLF